jgi:hypothetical protein
MLADDKKVLEDVEGILVYKDHLDPNIYYYSSTRPVVAQHGGQYQFTHFIYQPAPKSGPVGMLSFVVDLEPETTTKDAVLDKLPRHDKRVPELRPIPWTSGTVAVAVQGGEPVLGTPSLMGRNSAVVSLPLTTDQYLILKNSMDGEPVSVVYSLAYEAYRPAFEFSIEFDEEKFRKWVQTKCELDLLFISFESENTFEELKSAAVIRIKSVNQTGEEPPAGFRQAFLQSLQSLLTPLPKFAKPAADKEPSWRLGCSTITDRQIISRNVDCNMTISGAVARRANMQGALGGFAEAYKGQDSVTIGTTSPFMQKLTVRCDNSFDGKPLTAMFIRIHDDKTHTFDSSHRGEWVVTLEHDPRKAHTCQYRCTFYFDGDSLDTVPLAIGPDQAFLDILPEAFYTYRSYSVSAATDFPWELLTSVQLEPDPNLAITFEPPALDLTKGKPCGEITAFARNKVGLNDVSFTARYRPKRGKDFQLGLLPTGRTIFLDHFRKQSFIFTARADFDWLLKKISIRVTLPSHSLARDQELSFTLTDQPAESKKELTIWRWDDGRKLSFKTAYGGKSPVTEEIESVKRVVRIAVPSSGGIEPKEPLQGDRDDLSGQ